MDDQSGILQDIADSVRAKNCVLFLGAGVHAGPPAGSTYDYPDAQRPLIGSQVSEYLAQKSGFSDAGQIHNLQRVSLHFELEKGRSILQNEIRTLVQEKKKPSPLVRALAQLPFPIVITTNYDSHYEDAAAAYGKSPFVSFYRNNLLTEERTLDWAPLKDPTPEKPFVLKIHGDIERDPPSIVITEEDYIQFVLRMGDKDPYHPLPATAHYGMAKWPTLFIGYSLYDYNLRLLFKTLRWRLPQGGVPQMYSVDFKPDPLIRRVMQDQRNEVRYIVDDVWRFVPYLVRAVTGVEMTS